MSEEFSPFGTNLFGEPIEPAKSDGLAGEFTLPPFTVLNAASGTWQDRKRAWIAQGIKSELGRDAKTFNINDWAADGDKLAKPVNMAGDGVSIFDPVLCEMVYRWFTGKGDQILDPFAGGSVRGIIAGMLGRNYFGIDLRKEQVEENRIQSEQLQPQKMPKWKTGDSLEVLSKSSNQYADFVFSCPPYADLEVYSDDPRDLSTMNYEDFIQTYREIIALSCAQLKQDRFAAFVVGDIRCKKGFYRGFVGDTIAAFEDAGLRFYNHAILVSPVGTLALLTGKQFRVSRKMGKQHQDLLVFVKGDPRAATKHVST